MEITFEVSGGFIGGTRPTVRVDTADLETTEAEHLVWLVRAAMFFDQPAHASALPPGAADYQTYRITVHDGRRRHRIERTDPLTDDALAQLVTALQALGRASRRGGI